MVLKFQHYEEEAHVFIQLIARFFCSAYSQLLMDAGTHLESVLLSGQYERRDLLGELIVIIEFVLIEERLAMPTQILADLFVLRMLDDQFGDLLVAEVDGG